MKTTLTALLTVVGLAVLGSVESKPKEALGPQAKGRWMSPNLDGAKKCDMVEGKECFLKSSSAPRCCPGLECIGGYSGYSRVGKCGKKKCDMVEGKECFLGPSAPRCCPGLECIVDGHSWVGFGKCGKKKCDMVEGKECSLAPSAPRCCL